MKKEPNSILLERADQRRALLVRLKSCKVKYFGHSTPCTRKI